MKKFLVRTLVVIGALSVLQLLVIAALWLAMKERVPARVILEADFEQPLIEHVPDEPLAQLLLGRRQTVRDVVEALQRAADDKRVVGLIARVGESGMGLGTIQELRDAVLAFRRTGKPAIAHAETFGEANRGNGSYYLATAFDEIYLQPSGDVGLTGLIVESPFIRGTLEKLGLAPRLDHRHEYKNAMNFFTERQYTGPHREALQRLMESAFEQIVRGIAEARKLPVEQVRSLCDRGPFPGREALEAGLVDALAYRDQLYERLKQKAPKGTKFLHLGKYRQRAGSPYGRGETIAIIYGAGAVRRGQSGFDPLWQQITMGSDTVAGAFRAAVEDKKVKAIIFRVDSPGGSYVASDTIWRETVRARQAGKPVIVSMGDVAGSGGYFVAMAADKIVAQPGTVTGSIGVVGGKFLTTNFWDKLGVSWDGLHTSSNAVMFTGLRDYTPEQWAKFQQWLDRIYEDFTTKVAEGRKLPIETVLQIARGRIWSGEDAKTLGLVDELGGLPAALRLAREAAGLAADAPVQLKEFPPRKTLLQRLLGKGPDSSEPSGRVLARLLELARPAAVVARQLRFDEREEVLRMPEPVVLVP